MGAFDFVDPRKTPFVEPRWRGELPHLYKEGGSYFVTFRLWDAVVPRTEREPVTGTAGGTPAPQGCGAGVPPARHRFQEAIAVSSEAPLRLGSCFMARPEIATLVENALRHFDGQRYLLAAWCVLPNHVHAAFTPLASQSPSTILHSWKSFTAHQANRLLKRYGPFWERESFDHLIRSLEDFERFIRYIEENPVTAGLCQAPEDWPWSSARLRARKG